MKATFGLAGWVLCVVVGVLAAWGLVEVLHFMDGVGVCK